MIQDGPHRTATVYNLLLSMNAASLRSLGQIARVRQSCIVIRKLRVGGPNLTCLAASPGWGIAVSGSRDQTAIIWDLSRLTYVKNLPGHAGPVAAVNINELTGDIVR